MPAFWIAHLTVTDPERYKGYQTLAPLAFSKFGAKFLARGGTFESLEGAGFERHIVIEFSDLTTARACYVSPEYQGAKAERDGAAKVMITIVEGL